MGGWKMLSQTNRLLNFSGLNNENLELAYKYFGGNNYGKNYFSNPSERY